MINPKAKAVNNAKALPKDCAPIDVDGALFDWSELDPERAAEYKRLKAQAVEIIESLRPLHNRMHQLQLDTAAEYRAAKTDGLLRK